MSTRGEILNILDRVVRQHGFASLLLRNANIPSQEMGFASEVVYGTIRNQILLEKQWRPFTKHVKPRLATLLNMSVYQLFFLDSIPSYATIYEAVELAGKSEKEFVNAILRKVQAQGLIKPSQDTIEDISVLTSHPLWILQLWKAHYGFETMKDIALHNQNPSLVYGRINTLKMPKKELLALNEYRYIEDDCIFYSGVLQKTKQFSEGKIIIQDRNSQKVVRQLEVLPGMKVLDACAAPGTKTQQIACLMKNQGKIYATDLYEKRCALIDTLMEKTGVSIVNTACKDASVPKQFEQESFDRILIDAPCSGLGDLSHKPEIRWHLQPESIDELVMSQAKILDANAEYLKVGGMLVYSTCTLNKKENEIQIQKFLQRHPEYQLLQEKTLFPMEDDGDGFYYAKLKRVD
ncbi:MAG: 16S rRNA (cytosine(967)-C(5))-methyltransferase RsmB [Erysipelotrichaceae bacterium]|nr:16S rRNA (cytosine(967)-C(5))-methyltransferase RsmB [Erysipelotrichaceae bacterium]MDY6035259.1 16S rRNA (cytosine(967)-C(5))-methyltransferase RsmB [Bulleidia sp.]